MTRYAGERETICHTATLDGAALTPDDDVDVFVTLYTQSWAEVVVAETPMAWSVANSRWEYVWDTTDVAAGTYRIKVRIQGADGLSNWEYGRIALKADPVPV